MRKVQRCVLEQVQGWVSGPRGARKQRIRQAPPFLPVPISDWSPAPQTCLLCLSYPRVPIPATHTEIGPNFNILGNNSLIGPTAGLVTGRSTNVAGRKQAAIGSAATGTPGFLPNQNTAVRPGFRCPHAFPRVRLRFLVF